MKLDIVVIYGTLLSLIVMPTVHCAIKNVAFDFRRRYTKMIKSEEIQDF